jgi:hypothetical protein
MYRRSGRRPGRGRPCLGRGRAWRARIEPARAPPRDLTTPVKDVRDGDVEPAGARGRRLRAGGLRRGGCRSLTAGALGAEAGEQGGIDHGRLCSATFAAAKPGARAKPLTFAPWHVGMLALFSARICPRPANPRPVGSPQIPSTGRDNLGNKSSRFSRSLHGKVLLGRRPPAYDRPSSTSTWPRNTAGPGLPPTPAGRARVRLGRDGTGRGRGLPGLKRWVLGAGRGAGQPCRHRRGLGELEHTLGAHVPAGPSLAPSTWVLCNGWLPSRQPLPAVVSAACAARRFDSLPRSHRRGHRCGPERLREVTRPRAAPGRLTAFRVRPGLPGGRQDQTAGIGSLAGSAALRGTRRASSSWRSG